MKLSRYILFNVLSFLFPVLLMSENVTLESFLRTFEKNSTSINKIEFYKQISSLEKDNLAGEFLPKLNLVGQISYQSETIKLPISSPLFAIEEIPKDQYYSALELEQLVFDGFAISRSRKLSEKKFEVNEQSAKLESIKQKELIIKLFFNGLMLQKQREINLNVTSDLNSKKKQFESMLTNGVLLKSALSQLEIEIIKREQDLSKLEKDIQTIKKTLFKLTQIPEVEFDFSLPNSLNITPTKPSERPEYILITKNQKLLEENKSLINSNYYPKVIAFAKLGYASPNPNNFFETDFSFFYNVGIRLKFELYDWGKNSRNKDISTQNSKILEQEKINFIRNFESQINEEENNIRKFDENIQKDFQIISLQKEILNSSYSQLINGTITMTEYISQFNNLERAQINYEIDNILKSNSIYNYKIKSNSLNY